MKFMKLGTSVDTFYTEDNVRTLDTDVPSDLTLHINNTSFHLHKYALLPKCGILQETFHESSSCSIELHDVPGGEEAFELCAKFCYGILIHISAENFVLAYCASRFLHMTEIYEKGNFVQKLESFFMSCILEGWKDSILALESTLKLPDHAEEVGITRRCIDSIVDKILVPPPKVSWSFTYSRPEYEHSHHAVPIDWWTEDLSILNIELFRGVLVSVRTTNILSPQLIGEALHVYASCNLLCPKTSDSRTPESMTSQHTIQPFEHKKQMLEIITVLIPAERSSVSTRFLLKLLSLAYHLDMNSSIKSELTRRCSAQLEDATVDDLLLVSSPSSFQEFYDIELVKAVLENYLIIWRRLYASHPNDKANLIRSIQKVGKLIDSFLQVVAGDQNMPVSDIISLAKTLPKAARPCHDELYQAINMYLKEHPELPKAEKKSLCSMLDCEKLSHEVAAHAVKNELLPLRTVVQVLFFEQERARISKATNGLNNLDLGSSFSYQETVSDNKSNKNTATSSSTGFAKGTPNNQVIKDVSRTLAPQRRLRFRQAVMKVFHPQRFS